MIPIEVTAAVIEKDGNILLAQRKRGSLAGFWEFPGGKIEPGETPEECLAREIFEEFGTPADVCSFIADTTHDYGDKIVHLMAFRVTVKTYNFLLQEHEAVRWVEIKDLFTMQLAPADIPIAKALIQQ